VERLRQSFDKKIDTLEQQLMRAKQTVEREQEQYDQQKVQTTISVAATLFGAVLGRKTTSIANLGRATTAARGASRISREKEDIERALQQQQATRAQLDAIEKQLSEEADRLAQTYDPQAETLQEVIVRPAKADILLQDFGLLWIPYWHCKEGNPEPLYR
jgi:ABC-type transporter Mla subunit MlaD